MPVTIKELLIKMESEESDEDREAFEKKKAELEAEMKAKGPSPELLVDEVTNRIFGLIEDRLGR